MAHNTQHYNIVVPDLGDAADVTVLGEAIDTLDEEVYGAIETCESGVATTLDTALGDLGGSSVAQVVGALESSVSSAISSMNSTLNTALSTFASSIPTLVTSAIGSNVEQAVDEYMTEYGLSVDVSNVGGALAGVGLNGMSAVTPVGGSHLIDLNAVVSVNGVAANASNQGAITIDTGVGAIKSIAISGTSTVLEPDVNGQVTLDAGTGSVKSVNNISPNSTTGNVVLSAADISGSIVSIVAGNVVHAPNSSTHRVLLPVITSVNGHTTTPDGPGAGAITINTGVVQLPFTATINSSTVTLLDSGSGYYHYSVPVGSVTVGGASYTISADDVAVLAPNEAGFTSAAAVESFRDIFSDIWGAETSAGILKFYLPYVAPSTSLPVLLKVVRSVA